MRLVILESPYAGDIEANVEASRRGFNRMRNFALCFIGLVFALIVAFYVLVGYAVFHPKQVAHGAGEVAASFVDGLNENQNQR